MEVRYRYRLKPEVEKKFKETRLKKWEKFIKFYPHLHPEDRERLKEIFLHKLPGVDPKCLIEEAKKLKNKKISKLVIEGIKTYYYKADIPVPNEWIEGVEDKIGFSIFLD